jgi:hypothetical protein
MKRSRGHDSPWRLHRLVALASAAALLGAVLALPQSAHAADDTFVDPFNPADFPSSQPTDADSQRISAILANTNKFALTTWWYETQNFDTQGASTYLTFGGTAEGNIRPSASEAFALAVALQTGQYNAATVGTSTASAKGAALKLVRSLAYHHLANTAGGWGNGWQTALWAAMVGQAGWMLWADLSATDREYVRKMVEYEANRFIGWQVPYYKDRAGTQIRGCDDSAAEESAWNARLLFLAPVMMPQHSRRSGWTYKANELSIGAFAAPATLSDVSLMRGRPVTDWIEGTNVENDGSMVNHNRYHPDYMAGVTESIVGGMIPALAGSPVPTNALRGTSLQYDSLVDKSWWPSPAKPCATSPGFVAPGASNPTGTVYVDGSESIYYPEGTDWGTGRRAHFMSLDVMVRSFGLDSLVAQKADYWENLHAQTMLDRQLSAGATDGGAYRTYSEDIYGCAAPPNYSRITCKGREEWVAARAAESWLAKWLAYHGALTTTNSDEQIVIDNADRGVSVAGTWSTGSSASNGPQVFGPSNRYKTQGGGGSYVRFAPRMSATRSYDVYAWWNSAPSQATNAPFTINYASGTATVYKNQQASGGQWILLGTYSMGPGDYVQLADNANGYVVADAVMLDPN